MSAAPPRVNFPHGSLPWRLFPLGLPFTTVAVTPGELPSQERGCPRGTASHRRVHELFRQSLISWRYPPDRVGRARRRGTFTGQCCQPFCPGDPARHPDGPSQVTEHPALRKHATASDASANDGAWHPARAETRRLLDYLRLVPSSAQVAPHRWLHTPKRVRAEIPVRARTLTGRIRLGHFSYHDKVAPFID